MEQIKNRRDLQRQLILGAAEFVLAPEFQNRSAAQLETRLDALRKEYAQFSKEQQLMAEHIQDDAAMTELTSLSAAVQETFVETVATIDDRIQAIKESKRAPTLSSSQAARKRCKTHYEAIARAAAFVAEQKHLEQSGIELRARREQLKETYERFVRAAVELTGHSTTAEDADRQRNTHQLTEESYLKTLAALETRARELDEENGSAVHSDCVSGDRGLRLESIKLTKFDGDYARWTEWKAMYDSLIHNRKRLSETEKFHYLRKSLMGTAERVLAGWHTTGDNYQKAYETLTEVFDNKYRITMAHLEALFKMPKLSMETHEGLRAAIDTMNRSVRQLGVTGSPVEHWDHLLVHLILSRMPPRTLAQWNSSQDLVAMPSLEDVMKFLERRARSAINAVSDQRAEQKTRERTSMTPKPSNVAYPSNRTEQKSSGLRCFKCNGSHPLYHCKEMLNLSVQERSKFVKNLKRCFNCLQQGHEAGSSSCKSGPCPTCKTEYHNSMLCPKPRKARVFAASYDVEEQSDTDDSSNFY